MRYTSGKTRIAKYVAETIAERECKSHRECFVSPFCGGLSVETRLAPYFDRIVLNDKQRYLIELYRSVQNGWMPPDEVSFDEYYYVKQHKEENPALTAFMGFGCSFAGKWWGVRPTWDKGQTCIGKKHVSGIEERIAEGH